VTPRQPCIGSDPSTRTRLLSKGSTSALMMSGQARRRGTPRRTVNALQAGTVLRRQHDYLDPHSAAQAPALPVVRVFTRSAAIGARLRPYVALLAVWSNVEDPRRGEAMTTRVIERVRPPARASRVYAAHPVLSYGTAHEAACLDAIAGLLPEAVIINPAGRYRTSAGWLRAWPRLVRTLSAVVLFAAEDGTIGTGCLRELADAIRAEVPVAVLDDECQLRELVALELLPADSRSALRAAVVVTGGVLAIMYSSEVVGLDGRGTGKVSHALTGYR